MRAAVDSVAIVATAVALGACADAREAPRVQRSVVVDSTGLTEVETDLGFRVEVTEAALVVENIQFAIAGEAHASLRERLSELLIRSAHAHPGHFQAGDVTGELRGRFVLRFAPGQEAQPLGDATLVVGRYQSANFTFGHATELDAIDAEDPLLTHTAWMRGWVSRDDEQFELEAALDAPEARQLVGAPFAYQIDESGSEALGLRLLTRDPLEGDTLFDGIDFAALDGDGDGRISIEPAASEPSVVDAYNVLRRTFQTHDHFDVRLQPSTKGE